MKLNIQVLEFSAVDNGDGKIDVHCEYSQRMIVQNPAVTSDGVILQNKNPRCVGSRSLCPVENPTLSCQRIHEGATDKGKYKFCYILIILKKDIDIAEKKRSICKFLEHYSFW